VADIQNFVAIKPLFNIDTNLEAIDLEFKSVLPRVVTGQ
jgi:hypothetical protein